MRRFFTADTHFGGYGVAVMMGRTLPSGALCACEEEHDFMLISNINKMVDRDDELIIAGDFAHKTPGRYRMQINCKHIRFVRGNHDKVEKCSNVFGQLHDILYTRARDRSLRDYVKCKVSHYPYAYWDMSHRGWCNLYGHNHAQREETLDDVFPGRRACDIGVDNAFRLLGEFRPFAEYEIYEYMARREGHDDLRFYRDFQAGLYTQRGLWDATRNHFNSGLSGSDACKFSDGA